MRQSDASNIMVSSNTSFMCCDLGVAGEQDNYNINGTVNPVCGATHEYACTHASQVNINLAVIHIYKTRQI